MGKTAVINQVESFVKARMTGDVTGHDWFHADRVRKNALRIAGKEGGDLFVIELAALLHDIADWKFHGGDEKAGARAAKECLEELDVGMDVVSHVCEIIATSSFKGAGVKSAMKTKEGMIVQDADRLDALGAVGIARCFVYNGHAGRLMYDPAIAPELHETFDQYKKSRSSAINHFYEKLLLLKGLMNTATAMEMAQHRHKFMETFLEEFMKEWNGNA